MVKDDNFIATIGKWENKEGLIGCVNIYGPNDQKEREELWKRLDQLCAKEEVRWVLFGDFNEVRGTHERLNLIVSSKGSTEFNEFIRRNKLEDVRMGGSKFTRVSDDGKKFSKLDRFLITRSFEDQWRNIGARTLERKWPDHTPILLSDKEGDFGPVPFKFFDVWLSDSKVDEVVKRVWRLEPMSRKPDCKFRDKLKNVKKELSAWRKTGWGDIDKEVGLAREAVRKWELRSNFPNLEEADRARWL